MEKISKAEKFVVGQTYEGVGEVSGIKFRLVKRHDDLCLFNRNDGYWEIIKLRQQEESSAVIGGVEVTFKEREVYPNGNSWDGKCVKTQRRALDLYDEILNS